jgi:hypothetical protein
VESAFSLGEMFKLVLDAMDIGAHILSPRIPQSTSESDQSPVLHSDIATFCMENKKTSLNSLKNMDAACMAIC